MTSSTRYENGVLHKQGLDESQDVNEFHTTLRRSLTFDTNAIGASGSTAELDLPGGEKSR